MQYSYLPLVVNGAGFLISTRSEKADYMKPQVMFRALIRTFASVDPEDLAEEDLTVTRHFNFEPPFDFTLTEEFKPQSNPAMGAILYTYPKHPNTSFVVLPVDLTPFAGSPITSVFELLRMNWQQGGIRHEILSSRSVKNGSKKIQHTIVRGEFEPGTVSKSQISYYNAGQWSVAFIWQSPEELFNQSWVEAGNKAVNSVNHFQ